MESFEEKACHCGSNSDRLSDVSYGEPPVAGSSGSSFPSGESSIPLPIPPPSAPALSDAMDAEVRSCLFQHCKSKQHPHRFAPFPKGWKADRACQRQQTFHPRLEVDYEQFVRTQNL